MTIDEEAIINILLKKIEELESKVTLLQKENELIGKLREENNSLANLLLKLS